MRRSGQRLRRQRNMLNDLSLTPLIDTALTLLIIFMIAAPMMQNAIRITLPKGAAKEDAGVVQEVIVSIDKNGTLFLNEEKVTSNDELIKQIVTAIGSQKEKTVFVRADQGASYGRVIELVDSIKTVGGIKYVALATSKNT